MVKRLFDIVFAGLVLIMSLPLLAVIALMIKLSSSGPILFKQERVTKKEKIFEILKFRTMIQNAEAKTGPTWVAHADNRITGFGRFLRQTHLDEFPQLLNVLSGDMSLVGPRPERPVFVEQFKNRNIPNYSLRHTVHAGITGYAQLLYPNPDIEEIALKTEADAFYVQNRSLWLDAKILFQTGLFFLESFIPSK